MKTIIGALVLVGVVVVYINRDEIFKDYTYEREASTVEVIEVEKEAWMTDEDAVKAAQDVIKKKELEAELTALEASFASSTEAYKAEEKAYKAKKIELEKTLGTF